MRGIVGSFLMKSYGDNHKQRLIEVLRERSFVPGEVTLASGKKSSYYFDCKLTTLNPEGALLAGYAILKELDKHGIQAEAIGGPAIGAIPIVSAVVVVSQIEGRPIQGFLVREHRKQHGLQKIVEGLQQTKGTKVVIVDEVCTKGDSTIRAIEAARQEGLEIVAVISLVDRQEGGSDRIQREYPYPYYAVCTSRELLEGLREATRESAEAHVAP